MLPHFGGNAHMQPNLQSNLMYPGANVMSAPVTLPNQPDQQLWSSLQGAFMNNGTQVTGPPPTMLQPPPGTSIMPSVVLQGASPSVSSSPSAGLTASPVLGSAGGAPMMPGLMSPGAVLGQSPIGSGGPHTPFNPGMPGTMPAFASASILPNGMLLQPGMVGSQVTAAFHNLASLVPGMLNSPNNMLSGALGVPFASPEAAGGQARPTASPGEDGRQPKTGPAVTTLNESDWKEYKTNEGRIFWHNGKTNRSTWEKPEELRTDFERILSTISCWREFPQTEGEFYWHNSETKESEWHVPDEVRRIKQMQEELEAEDWSDLKIQGKSDARSKFREFLERKGVGHMAVWDAVHKILAKDKKWTIFNSVLTLGERKHVFNEYVTLMVKKSKEEKRMKKVVARDKLAEFLQKWKNGEVEGLGKMQPDSVYDDLPDRVEWRILDTRERFETFEEVASQVAATAIQKCSARQAEEITRWFKIVRNRLLPDDSSLDDVINFTRKYYAHNLDDVNDLSICQQWKSLLTNALVTSGKSLGAEGDENCLSTKVFKYEADARTRVRNLLKACEEHGLLNAKTEAQDFSRLQLTEPLSLDDIEPIGVSDQVEQKRTQILAKLKSNVAAWLEKTEAQESTKLETLNPSSAGLSTTTAASSELRANQSESPPAPKTHPVCMDNRILVLHLQGGSSVLELFNDYVYVLWDLYEVVRDEAKTKIREAVLKTADDVDAWLGGLDEKYQRPGVIDPLRQYCLKRIGRSNATTEEDEEEEEGGIQSGGIVREKGEIIEEET